MSLFVNWRGNYTQLNWTELDPQDLPPAGIFKWFSTFQLCKLVWLIMQIGYERWRWYYCHFSLVEDRMGVCKDRWNRSWIRRIRRRRRRRRQRLMVSPDAGLIERDPSRIDWRMASSRLGSKSHHPPSLLCASFFFFFSIPDHPHWMANPTFSIHCYPTWFIVAWPIICQWAFRSGYFSKFFLQEHDMENSPKPEHFI